MIDRPSPNFDERGDVKPSLLILHYTGMTDAKAALDRLTNAEAKVSAHYTVDEDGTIYCHVDESKRAWHAGHSFWRGEGDINAHSIGIEIVNPGHEFGYRAFPNAQIEAVKKLSLNIMVKHGLEAEDVLAHSDVAPGRKTDPGERFPWYRLAKAGVGIWPSPSEDDVVKATGFHIERALHDFGYDPRVKLRDKIVAFQRHFVPEVFDEGQEGEATSLTKTRLHALLAGHWLDLSQ